MSGAGTQTAPAIAASRKGRSPLGHLLHALNQPLTGLQCSLELALAGPRRPEQYVQTLSEGLELVSRMRLLAEALRELTDLQAPYLKERTVLLLDHLLRDAALELQPVAEARNVRLRVAAASPLPVRADLRALTTLIFRSLESVLSLSQVESEVQIEATNAEDVAALTLSWIDGEVPQYSPFSSPELGLLIASAGWEHLSGSCTQARTGDRQIWKIRVPLAWSTPHSKSASEGECQ